MVWIFLVIAGFLEVGWALSMKQSEGFTKLGPSILTIGLMILSFGLLSYCMRTLPLGTAYAIWTGIGAVGSFVVGIAFLGDMFSPLRILSVSLIVLVLVGLKLATHTTLFKIMKC